MMFLQVLAVRDKLPDLRAIVQYGEEEVEHEGVVSWEDFQVIMMMIFNLLVMVVVMVVMMMMMMTKAIVQNEEVEYDVS